MGETAIQERLRARMERLKTIISGCSADGPRTELSAQYKEAGDAIAAIDTLIEALRVSEAALKPFADTVFNDNGDVTITTSDLQIEDYMRAESGRRKALAAITSSSGQK